MYLSTVRMYSICGSQFDRFADAPRGNGRHTATLVQGACAAGWLLAVIGWLTCHVLVYRLHTVTCNKTNIITIGLMYLSLCDRCTIVTRHLAKLIDTDTKYRPVSLHK